MFGECYRIEDADSQAWTTSDGGTWAANPNSQVVFESTSEREGRLLKRELGSHLDPSNPRKTAFISCYRNKRAVYEEAIRRVAAGKRNVRIIRYDLWTVYGRIKYRNVRALAKKLGVWIPRQAYRNSEFEYIILHHIPPSAIVSIKTLRR